jgi:hypothetical protein
MRPLHIKGILLRFLFIFFIVQIVPLDWKFYYTLFTSDNSVFYNLFLVTKYYPRFFGIEGFGNWAISAAIAIAGTAIWTYRNNPALTNEALYYWLRVILRYRLAAGIIAYGLIKLFPLQMPYPSLSNLHTNYGDFQPWKIYFHTVGITQNYEIFLGAVEVTAGILLLFRKTATFGAGIIAGFTGNVVIANIAYRGGEQYYSAWLLLMALVIFLYDAPRLYRLLVQGKYTVANRFKPSFTGKRIRTVRSVLKTGTALFLLLLSVVTYSGFVREPYKLPSTPGLKGTYGFYNVREFRYNNKEIPYTTTDPDRWQNVIFEKWATVSIKIAKPEKIDISKGDEYHAADEDRNYESAGVAGRHYYSYTAYTTGNTLALKNKNPNNRIETYNLHYTHVNDSTIILQGVNERKDSVYAVLDRINKKYMLFEGRRKPVKL